MIFFEYFFSSFPTNLFTQPSLPMFQLEKLIDSYINEKSTKTLLPYDNIVDDFNLILKNTPLPLDDDTHKMLAEIEIERISYFIKEYILCRFEKIRGNFYLETDLMSEGEKSFYLDYINLIKQEGVYKEIVEEQQKPTEFVGFIANRNMTSVKIDNDIIEIVEGDFFIADLQDVYYLLLDKSISLV